MTRSNICPAHLARLLVWPAFLGLPFAHAQTTAVAPLETFGQVGCQFDSDSANDDQPLDISCSLLNLGFDDLPLIEASARSTVAVPGFSVRLYIDPDTNPANEPGSWIAEANGNIRFYHRLRAIQPLPFEPENGIPMLWVTRGQLMTNGPAINPLGYSQFINETGANVATYLLDDQPSHQRLRPYRLYGTDVDWPLDLFFECYASSLRDDVSMCEMGIEAFAIFDQAKFEELYGSNNIELEDYFEILYSDGINSTADLDQDGVTDHTDNCTFVANPLQRDSDSDGFGNLCDADFNNDCVVNVLDLGQLRAGYFSNDPVLDLDANGVVNAVDLGIFRTLFLNAPGPSPRTVACRSL